MVLAESQTSHEDKLNSAKVLFAELLIMLLNAQHSQDSGENAIDRSS